MESEGKFSFDLGFHTPFAAAASRTWSNRGSHHGFDLFASPANPCSDASVGRWLQFLPICGHATDAKITMDWWNILAADIIWIPCRLDCWSVFLFLTTHLDRIPLLSIVRDLFSGARHWWSVGHRILPPAFGMRWLPHPLMHYSTTLGGEGIVARVCPQVCVGVTHLILYSIRNLHPLCASVQWTHSHCAAPRWWAALGQSATTDGTKIQELVRPPLMQNVCGRASAL